jgi:uncharacterized repeat protein (TIGR01451 family)
MEPRVLLAIFTVTTTSDTPVAPTQDVPNPLTLRQAITLADSTPGPDAIQFNLIPKFIPGYINYDPIFEAWTIDVGSALPTITDMVNLDGYSQKSLTGSQGVDAVETLTLGGTVTGGTFTLTFDAETTAPLPFNATADQVSAALQALPRIGAGNVAVAADSSNHPINQGVLTVTFVGGLQHTAVEPITGDPGGLTGVNPTVDATLVTQGVNQNILSTQNKLPIGFNAAVRVILEGGNGGVPANFTGITIQSDHNIVRGLSIDGFQTGVSVQGPSAIGNLIQGNYVGNYILFPKPELNDPNAVVGGIGNGGDGVDINAPTNNMLGGVAPETHNAVAGNGAVGVFIAPGAFGNNVVGNIIGVLQQDAGTYFQDGNLAEGVLIESSSNVIGGVVTGATNVISANEEYGIHVEGAAAFDNEIFGNYVGTDPGGTFQFGQGFPGNGQNMPGVSGNLRDGIFIDDAPNTEIGSPGNTFSSNSPASNVISGNFGDGVRVSGSTATNTTIVGNFIGTNIGGTSALPNSGAGVEIFTAHNSVTSNLISGNERGVYIEGASATGNSVVGNFIGTDIHGNYKLNNAFEGVRIEDASNNIIGGTTGALANLISGNNVGIAIVGLVAPGVQAMNNLVIGNVIGTNDAVTLALGNALQGVLLENASDNTVGGTASAAGNVISGNHWGLEISGAGSVGNVINSNFIGTDRTAKIAVGNEVNGILIDAGTSGNTIGGAAGTAGNTIQFNLSVGQLDQSAGANTILSNTILLNGSNIADVSLTEVATPSPATAGTNFSYTLTVTDNGPNAATNILLTDILPAGVTFVSVTASQGSASQNQGTISASLQTLAVGASATVTIVVKPTQTGTITNTATVVANEIDPDPTNNTTALVTLVVAPTPLIVTTTQDSGPGSLRAAITFANSNPGPHTISFDLPARNVPPYVDYDPNFGTWTIHVASPLPAITGNVTIDGYPPASTTSSEGGSTVQLLTLGGVVVGGTFTLTFDSETTAPLPFNATADNVSKALQALPAIGPGNVDVTSTVTNSTVNTDVFTIKFLNQLANTSLAITGDGSALVGNAPSVSITTPLATKFGQNTLTIGFNAGVDIIVEGSATPDVPGTQASFPGLVITSAHNIIRGLIIDGFSAGIAIQGPTANGNLIQGDYVGQYLQVTKSGATVAGIGNGVGIDISAPTNNVVGGVDPETHNAISGNVGAGIILEPGANGNEVTGNLIGVLQQDASTYFQVGNGAEGLLIESSSNVVGGAVQGATNIISSNTTYGIHIEGAGAFDNQVLGNYIGTDPAGTFVFGQGSPGNGQNTFASGGNQSDGIFIDNAPQNAIGSPGAVFSGTQTNNSSNVISGNFADGVRISGVQAIGNSISGNFIGTNLKGTTAVPNAGDGVGIFSANTLVSANLISGNNRGVFISGANATGNRVVGNTIGLDAKGAYKIANSLEGVRIEDASNNTVGGTAKASANLISGNNVGIAIVGLVAPGVQAMNNLVVGNLIGTDATVSLPLGNSLQGVLLENAADNTVGGSAAGAGNVISANHWGVEITGASAKGNVLYSNIIGTDPTKKLDLGNELNGVLITNNAAGNSIGGPPSVGNTIADNMGDGVRIETNGAVDNAILSNAIFSNGAAGGSLGGIGINLVGPNDLPSGVTPNTPGGPHVGPNNLQNFPVLTLATSNISVSTSVDGSLNSTPNTTFIVQIFSNPMNDPSGFGQGQTLLGTETIKTDANGDSVFSFLFHTPTPAGQFITATATDPNGNTSEFSAGIEVQHLFGKLQFSQASYTVTDTDGVAVITVNRVDGSSGVVSVHFATSNATPNAQIAYVPTSGTLTFPDGVTTETFTVQLIASPVFQPDQIVNLTLTNPMGGATLGTPSTALLVIRNHNEPQIGSFQFSSPIYDVIGGSGVAVITVTRIGGEDGLATVAFATAGGNAVPGVDYIPESGTLVFPAGATEEAFTVPILAPVNIVGDKSVGLFLSNATGTSTLGSPSAAVLTILDIIGPTVQSVQLIKNSLGWTTGLTIVFSEPLNAETATNLLNYGYAVRTAGHDHIFGTRDDLLIPIVSATYNASTMSVTLKLGRPIHPPTPFQLTINQTTSVPGTGVGVSDTAGNLLDGANNGVNGTPFVAILIPDQGGIVPPPQLPPKTRHSLDTIESHRPATKAVDTLLASGSLRSVKSQALAHARSASKGKRR